MEAIHASPMEAGSLMISESLGAVALSNPCITRGSSLFMISEFIGAVSAVEPMRHPWESFLDDF